MKISEYPIIGFKGGAGAGKTTAAQKVVNLLNHTNSKALKMSFASPLKELCFEVFGTAFGIDQTAFYGSQDQKNAPLEQLPGWTGRKILQYIGTEGFRHVSPETWPRYAINAANKMLKQDGHKHVVFDDLRFVSEADALQQAGGIIIEIQGGHVKQAKEAQGIPGHASESEMDRIKADYTIQNTEGVEQFYAHLQEIL